MNSFVFAYVLLCLTVFATVHGQDLEAQSKCRALHHMDADSYGTQFLNNHCLLNCNIHGKILSHAVNEGQTCLIGALSHVCRNGQCVANQQLGHIDVEVISASLVNTANAYATVCIQNSSVPMTLPIHDRTSCVSCSTNLVSQTTYPVWNSVCAGSSKYLFSNLARITIEVWDHHGVQNNVFIGGASVTIPQMLAHNDNYKQLHLALAGGINAGQVNARITWTPK